jgi:cell division protein FtsB
MTGREQERRRRRGEPAGGAPSRRTDRSDRFRRGTTAADSPEPVAAAEPDADGADGYADEYAEEYSRRPSRRRRAPGRRLASRVLGRLTTRRAALLALVVCALALSVAVPLNTYLSQRDDLYSQQQQQQALRAQESQLEQRESQLSDTAEVEAEARTRLHFVMPGETPYEVQLPAGAPAAGQTGIGQHPGGPTASWYQTLWNSIVGSH